MRSRNETVSIIYKGVPLAVEGVYSDGDECYNEPSVFEIRKVSIQLSARFGQWCECNADDFLDSVDNDFFQMRDGVFAQHDSRGDIEMLAIEAIERSADHAFARPLSNVQIEGQPASGLSLSNAGLGSAKGD